MTRERFLADLERLSAFAHKRSEAYAKGSAEHGIWRRIHMALEQAKSELPA